MNIDTHSPWELELEENRLKRRCIYRAPLGAKARSHKTTRGRSGKPRTLSEEEVFLVRLKRLERHVESLS